MVFLQNAPKFEGKVQCVYIVPLSAHPVFFLIVSQVSAVFMLRGLKLFQFLFLFLVPVS